MSDSVHAPDSPDERARTDALADRFDDLGAPDPQGLAAEEVAENTPNLAAFLLLRRMWIGAVRWDLDPAAWIQESPYGEDEPAEEREANAALRRILAAGADPEDVRTLARHVFLQALSDAATALDEGGDPEEDAPGWVLAETDAEGNPTGRTIDSLGALVLDARPERLDPGGFR